MKKIHEVYGDSEPVTILNLTQHQATSEQIAAGVIEPSTEDKVRIQKLLTFTTCPSFEEVVERAEDLADLAEALGATRAMIGGAPVLMVPLHHVLTMRGILPGYAFSVRESVEEFHLDGSVRKVQVFKHSGFTWGWLPQQEDDE